MEAFVRNPPRNNSKITYSATYFIFIFRTVWNICFNLLLNSIFSIGLLEKKYLLYLLKLVYYFIVERQLYTLFSCLTDP